MKTFKLSMLVLFSIGLTLNFTGCLEDECTETSQYYIWEPVYMSFEELRSQFQIEAPRELNNPGKIYFYDNYIFISEPNEGIHTIDNSDPTNPTPVNFMNIPGNRDMAVKNGRLYADNLIDLLVIDITSPEQPALTARTENVFVDYNAHGDLGYLIDYKNTLETQEFDCQSNFGPDGWIWCGTGYVDHAIFASADFSFAAANSSSTGPFLSASASSSVPSVSVGVGGSFARFTISKNHLYAVSEFDLSTFDLSDCDEPSHLGATHIGWGIETIFPLGENLFIGSNSGMFIYSIENASEPLLLSQFQHARACDPVYVVGNKAYVTLRDGNQCGGFVNQLDVIDVSVLTDPQLITSYNMEHPHGLSIQGDNLYLCEGVHGIKVFDKSDDFAIAENQLSMIEDLHAYDIITLPNQHAMIIGDDGLYQYDITDPTDLKELSRISVNR